MPSSAVRAFTDPVEYFTGIRNLQIAGIVQRRGEFRARLTRIDLHRLWMHRFDEDLPRIMKVTPSGTRALIVFATGADQPAMQVNGNEISRYQIANIALDWEWYLRSSAPCEWGTMSLAPKDLRAAWHLRHAHCRGCGNSTKQRAILPKPLRTSSGSPRWRERSNKPWWRRWFSA